MPLYSYQCKKCLNGFDQQLPMDDRNKPESEDCPSCGEQKVFQTITAVTIGYNTSPNIRTSDDFNSRLKTMRKKVGSGHTLDKIIR